MKLFVPIILGTARKGRRSEIVAHHVLNFAKTLDIEVELFDVKDFPQSFTQEPKPEIKRWQEAAERADAFVIVSPEYNHGYPGELKLFIDNVYTECNRKPIAFVGVSVGPLGGARAVEQLRLVAVELHMVPIRTAVYFGHIVDLIAEDNTIKDSAEWDKRLTQLFDELLWYAHTLREQRIAWNKARA